MVAVLWANKNYYRIIKLYLRARLLCASVLVTLFFLPIFLPSPFRYYRVEEGIPCGLCKLQTNKANKDKKTWFTVLTVYLNTHPLFPFHSEQALICITLQTTELQLSDSITLFWSLCRIDKVFLRLPEIADIPLGELNKDTVLRGTLRNLTNENIRQQKSAHVQRKVTTTSVTAFSKNLGWLIKCSRIFLMCFSHDMMDFSRHACGGSGLLFHKDLNHKLEHLRVFIFPVLFGLKNIILKYNSSKTIY